MKIALTVWESPVFLMSWGRSLEVLSAGGGI